MIRHIAMWSGPRNISTAMLRAWENRTDTVVMDEPFYAHYLAVTGLDHPAREAVLTSQPVHWPEVVEQLLAAPAEDAEIVYQKHMCQHMLENIQLHWLAELDHVFLIRAPEAVVASFSKVRHLPTASELGFKRQAELFDAVTACKGESPPIIDAADVLHDPETMLRTLCLRLNIEFSTRMLSWPSGPRSSDGVWAPFWYATVNRSTGFRSTLEKKPELGAHQQTLVAACRPYYNRLYRQRLH